jgi:predicted phage terminase large subunit-like protein
MPVKLTPNEYRTLMRRDLYAFAERCFYSLNPSTKFIRNWHIEVVASALEACRRGEIKRLIINQPPRSLKSHLASVSFVAFLLGHNPAAQIICASYGQDLANKHALDCRTIMASAWYQSLFPRTRLSPERQAVQDFMTTQQGRRISTSVGGMLTGRGADFIVLDDALKPDEALSDTQRKTVNDWFDHSLYSRLNDKKNGCIILVMQRLHEDDLVGHVLGVEPWKMIRLPAIAEEDETHVIETPYGLRHFERRAGEALDPEREPLEILNHIREALGEYNFAGQYLQAPAPLGGGMVKVDWFQTYAAADQPQEFEMIFQSWDTANKPTELNDFSVCSTWGAREKHIYLLHVCRKRFSYPELKRAVREQAVAFNPKTILIEDKASGTQLIQELVSEGMHEIKKYEPTMDKVMRMHSACSTVENGFVHLPDKSPWLAEYLHELASFPKGKYDDQVDSTSQALDWFKNNSTNEVYGVLEYEKREAERTNAAQQGVTVPESMPCSSCNGVMSQRIPGGLRCAQCGAQWPPPGTQRRVQYLTRTDVLNTMKFRRF